MPTYLDSNGNPIGASAAPRASVYLDANGEPMGGGSSAPTAAAPEDDSINPLWAAAGLLGAGGLALATHNPSAAKSAVGAVGRAAMDLRKMSMLSGLATIKSFLGNVGGAAMGSIERESLAPIREMLSPETFHDAVSVFKRGPNQEIAGPATNLSKFNLPGRVMGAFDEAGQNALQRAGYTSNEAAREMLQTPLPDKWQKALDHPVGDYLVPFRKTPYNQFVEGMNTFNPKTRGQALALGTSLATGAASGTMADDPKTIALTTAANGRYGLPHMLAAGAARAIKTGSTAKAADVMQGVGPVSDYSFTEGVTRPVLQPEKLITQPAAVPAWDYIKSLLGIQ